jgi:hypothetical protein
MDWRMPRATDAWSGFISDGSEGGMTGRPGNACSVREVVVVVEDICDACIFELEDNLFSSAIVFRVMLLSFDMIVSLWYMLIAAKQKTIEDRNRHINETPSSFIL